MIVALSAGALATAEPQAFDACDYQIEPVGLVTKTSRGIREGGYNMYLKRLLTCYMRQQPPEGLTRQGLMQRDSDKN
jgi:hypothetical protein